MARTEEQRRKATEATRRWRAKNPYTPTEAQRAKAKERSVRWRQRNPGKHTPFDPTFRQRAPWTRSLGPRQAHAKKRGIPFALKVADVRAVWTGKCALTGLPFDMRASTAKRPLQNGPRPFSPSLDRIKPELGYVSGNIRFILQCVNAFRGRMNDTLMRRVAARLC